MKTLKTLALLGLLCIALCVASFDDDDDEEDDDDDFKDCTATHTCDGGHHGWCILADGHHGSHFCGQCASSF